MNIVYDENLFIYININIPLIHLDVYKKAGLMRSVDWIVFLQAVVPTLVFKRLVEEYTSSAEQVDAIMSLVIGCTLALQWNIDQDDLVKINT